MTYILCAIFGALVTVLLELVVFWFFVIKKRINMAQIDIDKFVISLIRYFGEDKGIATRLDRCLFSLGLQYVDTPTGGRLERVDQPTMLERIFENQGEHKSGIKESEDERIRKDIVFYIVANHKDDGEKARWLYWLEKQGEQKPWSKEDKVMLDEIIDFNLRSLINDLKKL